MSDNYRNIGKLVATFGLQGEMVLQHRLGKKTAFKGLKAIFLEERKGEMLPWFVETVRAKGDDDVYIKLEGVDTKESARRLAQKEVWLPEAAMAQFADKSAPISLVGYHLWQGEKDLGEILEVFEQPHQVLCRIDLEGKEALIPIHEETLRKIDKKGRKVFVELPDGLLDIYR
ncbi:MAG TPA: ribosome maturation factor RimM [Puia sp.]|nr:ribosome maturation factor RimM [Puia sp.]